MKGIELAMVIGLAGLAMVGAAQAEPKAFDFKDPKGVNAMTLTLDSLVEPIIGFASGISGTVTFDPADPAAIKGKIVVAADSIRMSNETMTKVLHSADWIDVAEYPTVEFTLDAASDVKTPEEGVFEMAVAGTFTCHGVKKEMTIPVRVTYLPGKAGERLGKGEGDLLILRAEFGIERADFNIKPELDGSKVARRIDIFAGIVGMAAAQ